MLVDLHVHTSRYSKCAVCTPEEMMGAALERGLDAVLITDHNAVWTDEETLELRDKFPKLKIFRGIEVGCREGEDLLVFGMPDLSMVLGKPPAAELIETAHAAGGAVILAHPLRYRNFIVDALYETPPDACEGWSKNIYSFQLPGIMAFCKKTGCGLVAATDSHNTEGLGAFAVRFNREIVNEQELAIAVKQRDYVIHQNLEILSELEKDLPKIVEGVRAALALGDNSDEIHAQFGCSHSFIEHIKAGRYPSMVERCQ